MRFIVCGFGSIGRRHVNNLIKLGYKDIIIVSKQKIKKKYPIFKIVNRIEDGLKLKPNVALICNATSLHDESIILCAKNNCNLFVEKPISSTTKYEKIINNLIKKKKLTNMVGYMMRFHPAIIKLIKLINNKDVGRIFYVHTVWGEYLPNWHPNENYKNSYASKKVLGGGVSLTLSHDLDLLKHIFGAPKIVFKLNSNKSKLKLNVDTHSNFLIKFKNDIYCSAHLNYLMKKPQRYIKLIGEDGEIYFDYYKNKISVNKENSIKIYKFKKLKRNKMFIDEIQYFIECVKKKIKCKPSIAESFNLLREFKIKY